MSLFNLEAFFSLKTFAHKKLWIDDVVWSPLRQLKSYIDSIAHRIDVEVPEGVVLENRELISIGAGTVIEPGVLIQGPCVIGKGCIIRHGAYIRPYSLLGDRCVIGHSAEIKQSILLDEAAATHFVYVGDSIIGSGANLGAGVKCANLRLDRNEVTVLIEGKKVRTGLKKIGAIVGDRVQIGCNCVLNPGTLVGKDSTSYPLVHLRGFIPPFSRVKLRPAMVIEEGIDPKSILQQMGKQV